MNKQLYLKKGSAIAQSGKEDKLFDNMFEIVLREDYEEVFHYREEEQALKNQNDRELFKEKLREEKQKREEVLAIRKTHSHSSVNQSSLRVGPRPSVDVLHSGRHTAAAQNGTPFNLSMTLQQTSVAKNRSNNSASLSKTQGINVGALGSSDFV